ncbi:MAG: hypothetical protein DSY59_04570 [Persephonella sp.]|nr:MAG: hypothetical protein DSY59_04570 [Persephonella sp.]
MKRIISISLFFSISIFSFSLAEDLKTWKCHRYLNGEPTGGFVKVKAKTKEEAEKKAIKKYKEIGYKIDGVKCDIPLFW